MSDQLTALLNQHVETIKTTIDAEIKSAIDKHAPRRRTAAEHAGEPRRLRSG